MLSVVINTKNSEETLERALKSVKFADEIVVVDMKSTDETEKIARRFTDRFYSHPDVGYVEPARNFAIKKAQGDWILILDSDEEVSASLKAIIEDIIADPAAADCYYLPRKNIIFDHWMQKTGWWPDYVLRLFKAGHVEWSDEIHSIPITQGQVIELPADERHAIVHHNYQSVEQFINRLNRYTSIQAEELDPTQDAPKRGGEVLDEFSSEFLRRLMAQRGIDEGVHGVGLSLLQGLYQISLKLKVWEKSGFAKSRRDSLSTIDSLRALQSDLNYWIADWYLRHSIHPVKKLYWRLRRRYKM